MSYGQGFGTAFGGDPPLPLANPVSEVADDAPFVFDFSDDPDGPLPGGWEHYQISDDGSGVKVFATEPDPDTFYRVVDGFAQWKYLRETANPAPAQAFVEQGVAASPRGILQGRNAEIAVAFRSATELLDPFADEFKLEVLVGLRANDDFSSYIAARVRAEWFSSLGWSTPLAFEVVRVAGGVTTVIASSTFDLPDPLDLWRAAPLSEVRLKLFGSQITATLSGGGQATLESSAADKVFGRPLILVRCYNRHDTVFSPPPMIAGVQLQTLRDLERLGTPPTVIHNADLETPQVPVMRLPLLQLCEEGLLKRTGPRTFVVTPYDGDDGIEVDVQGVKYVFDADNVLRATEPVFRQALVQAVVDLASIRNRRTC